VIAPFIFEREGWAKPDATASFLASSLPDAALIDNGTLGGNSF
jgi:hypothetical protein